MKELRRIKNIRGIVTRLLVSFFFLFAAFLVKQFIVHYQMNQEENTFYVMNIAGRQRMLSQKITKDVAFLHEGETDYESELRFSLEQFQRSQERLIDLGEEDQLWYRDDHHILDLYEKINPNYQRLISLSNDYLREWNKPTPDEEKLVDYLVEIKKLKQLSWNRWIILFLHTRKKHKKHWNLFNVPIFFYLSLLSC